MKKIIAIVISLILMLGLLTGCAQKNKIGTRSASEASQGSETNPNSKPDKATAAQSANEEATISTGDKEVDSALINLDKDMQDLDSGDRDLDQELNSIQ